MGERTEAMVRPPFHIAFRSPMAFMPTVYQPACYAVKKGGGS